MSDRIKLRLRKAAEDVIEVGTCLIEARNLLKDRFAAFIEKEDLDGVNAYRLRHSEGGYIVAVFDATNRAGEFAWAGLDLNQRRQCRQVYSLFPLATRAPTQGWPR